ncbi:Flocculation suppression protein [Coemansia erecta]|uniref:Flocculation suppression protein n=1 Tax=Coemansia erecta TaxID=147472 RepID=A0A9W7Y2S2_9FUNG|nr:Flocculation suppression protein [Coemansia erecta]
MTQSKLVDSAQSPKEPFESDAAPTSPSTALAVDEDDSEQAPRPRLLIQKTHAAFVSKLYAMVADSTTDSLISWVAEGDCFKVTDPVGFSRNVLPVYFKHGNWQSFVRQLNMYGFHKINDLAYGGVFGDTQLWMFKHPFFQRDELKMLQKIKRRGPKSAAQQPGEAHEESCQHESATPATPNTPMSGQTVTAQDSAHSHPQLFPSHSAATGTDFSLAADAADGANSTRGNAAGVPASSHTSSAATGGSSPVSQYMNEYVHELKASILDLQESNTQLRQENQKMHATIASCQSAFAGIMSFLEATMVKPNAQTAAAQALSPPHPPYMPAGEGGSSSRHISDAFRKLVSEVAPVLSGADCSYSNVPPSMLSSSNPHALDDAPPAFFRTAATASNGDRSGSRLSGGNMPPFTHQHSWSRGQQTLPPIRPGPGSQSDSFFRVPSLSPPAVANKKRRSSSSSSGSSHDSSCPSSDENSMQPLTPCVVLPPISGVVGSILNNSGSHYEHKHQYHQLPFPASHQSSLRETLPMKRSRAD